MRPADSALEIFRSGPWIMRHGTQDSVSPRTLLPYILQLKIIMYLLEMIIVSTARDARSTSRTKWALW